METAAENKAAIAQSTPARQTFTEAPGSLTVKAVSPAGYDCLLTIRAGSISDCLQRSEAALVWLQEHNYRPTSQARGAAESEPPPEPGSTSPAAAEGEGGEDDYGAFRLCPLHHTKMRQRVHGDQKWWSHRLESGAWCKGRAK